MLATLWKKLTTSLLAHEANDSLGKCKELLRRQEFFGKAVNHRLAVFPKNGWKIGMKGGIIMKKQGGQDIVEFALMIPLFLLFIFTIMYFGFLYGDYITLSSLARSAAREAAIEGESIPDESKNDPNAQPSYQNLEDRYDAIIREKGITTHLYEYQGISISKTGDKTSDGIPANSVVVEIKTVRNKDFGVANALEEMGIKLLPQYTIEYYMYNENGTKSNS